MYQQIILYHPDKYLIRFATCSLVPPPGLPPPLFRQSGRLCRSYSLPQPVSPPLLWPTTRVLRLSWFLLRAPHPVTQPSRRSSRWQLAPAPSTTQQHQPDSHASMWVVGGGREMEAEMETRSTGVNCGLLTHNWHSCLEIARKSNHHRLVTDAVRRR